jgi:hypothetical protein
MALNVGRYDDGDESAHRADVWAESALGLHETMKGAIAAGKAAEGGKWKWAVPPGNGSSNAYFVCNTHIDCGRRFRASGSPGNFKVSFKGEHSQKGLTKGKRSNSTLSWEADEKLRDAADMGSRPSQLRVTMLKEKSEQLKEAGEDPLAHKAPVGGLEGAWSAADQRIQPDTLYSRRICIVSRCVSGE